jgi:hypothetical protein
MMAGISRRPCCGGPWTSDIGSDIRQQIVSDSADSSTGGVKPATIVGWKGAVMRKQAETGSGRWRRFASLSVRGLIVLILVVAGGLSWIANRVRFQRNAVDAIEKAGGKVWYDFEEEAAPTVIAQPRRIVRGEPRFSEWLVEFSSEWREWLLSFVPRWPPKWLVDFLGVDYFGNVVAVSFTRRASDAELVHVGKLRRVERLDLYGSPITASGLGHLQPLTHLQTLLLVRTKVGDAGLARLAALKNLRVLSLEGTELSDDGLAHLRDLTNLADLNLASTAVTDRGLAHLAGLTRLQALDLSRTGTTDAGLAHLEGLTNLQELSLDRTSVTDAGLAHLKRLASLTELTLDRTAISDRGLVEVEGLNHLVTLSLDHTKVTAAGVAKLQLHRAERQAEEAAAVRARKQPNRPAIPKLNIMN